MAPPDATSAAFFYGTLLHPKILTRVIGNDGSHLQICPALLLDYTRHQVKNADYPAIIPYGKSRSSLIDRDLPPEERCVRGTLVQGLTASDVDFLDVFEGDGYDRVTISAHPLAPLTALKHEDEQTIAPSTPPPVPSADALAPGVPAQTYVWRKPVAELAPAVWSYEGFVAQNAWKWVGAAATQYGGFAEVEERRAHIGEIARSTGGVEIAREET